MGGRGATSATSAASIALWQEQYDDSIHAKNTHQALLAELNERIRNGTTGMPYMIYTNIEKDLRSQIKEDEAIIAEAENHLHEFWGEFR